MEGCQYTVLSSQDRLSSVKGGSRRDNFLEGSWVRAETLAWRTLTLSQVYGLRLGAPNSFWLLRFSMHTASLFWGTFTAGVRAGDSRFLEGDRVSAETLA